MRKPSNLIQFNRIISSYWLNSNYRNFARNAYQVVTMVRDWNCGHRSQYIDLPYTMKSLTTTDNILKQEALNLAQQTVKQQSLCRPVFMNALRSNYSQKLQEQYGDKHQLYGVVNHHLYTYTLDSFRHNLRDIQANINALRGKPVALYPTPQIPRRLNTYGQFLSVERQK